MSLEKVRDYLAPFGVATRIQVLAESSATVELAAAALHTEGKRIAKSMSFYRPDHDGAFLVIFAGDARVDNHRFKETFHTKASMVKATDVERLTGHPVGGVCPFAVNPGVDIYLDLSLKRFTTVFPACGTGNSAIEVTLPELEAFSHAAGWVDVAKGWQEE